MQDVDLWSPGYKMSQLHYFIRWDIDVINAFMRNVLVTVDLSPPNSKSSCAKCEDRCCWGLAFRRKSRPELRATFDLQNLISAPLSGSGRLGLKFEVIPSGGVSKRISSATSWGIFHPFLTAGRSPLLLSCRVPQHRSHTDIEKHPFDLHQYEHKLGSADR